MQNIDSLENILNTQELTPDKQLQIFWNISTVCMHNDLDKTFLYSKKGADLSENIDNDLWIAKFNRMLGYCYMRKGNIDLSFSFYEKSIDYAVKAKSKNEEILTHLYIAAVYQEAGKHEEAIKYYIDLLPTLEKMEPVFHYTNALTNIAIIYQQLHNNEKAMEYCRKTLAIAEKQNLVYSLMGSYAMIGDIYYEKGMSDSAIVNVFKAYEISRENNAFIHNLQCAQILASIYSDLKNYREAEKYAHECLDAATRLGDKQSLLMAWSVMAKVKFDMEQYEECEKYMYKVWEADSTHLERAENATLYLCLANIYLENPTRAHLFLKKYVMVRDSISNQELYNSLADMEIKYETDKKEMQIASLEKERQMYIWLGVAGALFTIVLGIAFWLRIRSARKEKQLIATQSVLDGEMGERSRLARDLHDRLSGNLSAVKMGIKDNKESILNIQDKLDKCIDEIRRISHNLMPASLQYGLKVALGDFAFQFQNVQFHFFGEEKRVEERIEFVVYCCASELVNNSIRHSGAKKINLQLIQSEKHISITVQDDGCGFDEKSVIKGFGMKSIHDRITSCNGKIDMMSSPCNGTETTIELVVDRYRSSVKT